MDKRVEVVRRPPDEPRDGLELRCFPAVEAGRPAKKRKTKKQEARGGESDLEEEDEEDAAQPDSGEVNAACRGHLACY